MHHTLTVSNPKLWDIGAGNRYQLQTELLDQIQVLDCVEEKFGFRTIHMDPNEGFFLNEPRYVQPLIDQAIRYGVCRPDLTTQYYAMITAILRTSFQGLTDTEQQQLAQRAIELLLNGIRA